MGACAPGPPVRREWNYADVANDDPDDAIELDEFGEEIEERRSPMLIAVGVAVIVAFMLGVFVGQWTN